MMKHRAPGGDRDGDSQAAKPNKNKLRLPPHLPLLAAMRWLGAVRFFILMLVCKKQQAYFGMHFLLATEGKTFERSLAAFRATSAGWDLLQRRPKSWDYLSNRSMLQACPPGSLGSLYAAFMTTHGLDEKYYLGTVIENAARLSDDAECVWFRTRVEASHDMRHFLAGYGPDVLGEVCLLSFRFAQTRHAGTLALTLLGLLNLALTSRGPFLGAILEAYRRGRQARLLDLLPWEDRFAEPLSALRVALGLSRPRCYPASVASEAYGVLPAAPQGAGTILERNV
jgi:ubiquinone biosynthesis protein Coq4